MFKRIAILFYHSYIRKFIISFMVMAFLVLFGFHFFSFMNSTHSLSTSTTRHLKTAGQSSAEMIETYFSGKATTLRLLSSDPDIQAYLNSEPVSGSPAAIAGFDSASAALDTVKAADSSLRAVWLVSDSGNYYIANGGRTSPSNYNMKDRPWYQSLVTNTDSDAVWFSGAVSSLLSNEDSLMMVMPVAQNGNVLGYAGLEITLNSFSSAVNRMDFPAGVYPLIRSRYGEIIYSSASKTFQSAFPLSDKNISDILQSASGNPRELEPVQLKNNTGYIYSQSSPLTSWRIFIFFDGREIFREQQSLFLKNMLGSFVFIFAATAGILAVFAVFFKDFPALLNTAREYRKNNYAPKIHSSASDETREIADCLDALSAEIEEKNRILEELTFFDPMTKLPNRTKLYTYIDDYKHHANEFSSKFALVFISIDNFKWINDTLGHAFGDEFLIQFAAMLKKGTEQYGIVARFSGDEFVFLFNFAKNVSDVDQVVQKIKKAFTKPVPVFGEEMYVKFSIGIVIYPDDDRTAELLLRDADIAVNLAKENDFSGVEFYNDTLHRTIACKAMISQKLVNALNNGELYLNYQPIVSTSSKSLYGFEVLLRWTNPELGTIPPSEFIPIAEETGMIVPIGTWIFEYACRFYKKINHKLQRDFVLSINVSPHQLLQVDYVSNIRQVLEITQIKPSCIQLEITETVLITLFESASNVLRELSELGVTIALDDFGTGYNSLNYLKHFPINCLKIDKTFVDEIHKNKKDYAIADSIIDLVHNLNITTVAEGVETVGQYDSLNKMNCDLIQGYLMSKPLSEDKVLEFIAEFNHTYASEDN